MQKTIIGRSQDSKGLGAAAKKFAELNWLDLETQAAVEVTSEDEDSPIESALRTGGAGWRAAEPGPQIIRLIFNRPQRISNVRLRFTENETERTQEFVLRWGPDGKGPLREIVRQQWNFSPQGSNEEVEDYRVTLEGAAVLELQVNPDISGRRALASLDELRVA
jgi:hypothetical protein